MNAQQLHDYIIKPTLEYMGHGYDSKNARMLLLATAAIESDCGHYIKQINGPALGVWQMEPDTFHDIYANCDALKKAGLQRRVNDLAIKGEGIDAAWLISSPMYACAVARLKYSMDKAPIPDHKEIFEVYRYYKRIYNTPIGASTFDKFKSSWLKCGLDKIVL